MSDYRHNNRQDSRQTWDEPDRRAPRDRDRDSHGGRWGGRGHRDVSRNRRGPPRDRSRSPDRRYRDREDDRERGSGRDSRHGGSRRYDDRDWGDRRGDDDRRDRRGAPRDSRSRSPPASSLPSRPRTTDHKPQSSSRNPARSPPPNEEPQHNGDHMDEDKNQSLGADGEEPEEELDEDAAAMQAMLGFGGFGSTKGKKVAGNNAGAVKKEKKTEYRQYMNRVGGFNRPLSPSR